MTIFGQHTVAETRDLIRTVEFRVNKNLQQLQRVQAQRFQPTTTEQQTLDKDMATFVRRWTDVRDKQTLFLAASIAANPGVATFVLPAEQQFVAVDKASRLDEPRLMDLQQRIVREGDALGVMPLDLSQRPTPDSPDADFAALRKLDAAIAAGEAAAKDAGKAAGSAAKSHIGLLIGAGVLGVVGIVVATKVYL